jgi:hypothetical protein
MSEDLIWHPERDEISTVGIQRDRDGFPEYANNFCSSFSPVLSFVGLFCENLVEPGVVCLQRSPQHPDPLLDLIDTCRHESAWALGALNTSRNEPGLLQYAKVPRNCRLAH